MDFQAYYGLVFNGGLRQFFHGFQSGFWSAFSITGRQGEGHGAVGWVGAVVGAGVALRSSTTGSLAPRSPFDFPQDEQGGLVEDTRSARWGSDRLGPWLKLGNRVHAGLLVIEFPHFDAPKT